MKKGSAPRMTVPQLQELEKRGIRVNWPADMLDAKGKPKKVKKKCPYKERMEKTMIILLQKFPCYELKKEHRFAKPKQFKFDFAIIPMDPAMQKIAVEYEGIHSAKSRHTTKSGFIQDSEKYNLANAMGWIVFRYTANTIENIKTEIEPCLLTSKEKD